MPLKISAHPKMSYTATIALLLFSGPVTYTFWNPPAYCQAICAAKLAIDRVPRDL